MILDALRNGVYYGVTIMVAFIAIVACGILVVTVVKMIVALVVALFGIKIGDNDDDKADENDKE